jgi:HEAT repeat protein
MGPLAKPAIPALRRALKDPGDGVPVLAAEALVRIDPRLAIEVVPSLATNLQRHHLVGSREICALLATLGPAAKEAVPALRQAAREGEVYDRLPALAALMQVDPTEARAFVPDLAAALRNPKVGLRCDAAWLLGQKGAAARAAVPDLIAALNEPGLRIPAAWALGRIGPAAKDAVPALLAAFQGAAPADPPEAEVATAVRAILAVMAEADPLLLEGVTNGGFGTPIQAEDIFAVREGRDPEPTVFRRVAAFALGGIGTDSPDVRQALLAARRDADPHLRLQGAVALARVAPTMAPDVMPGLRAALRDQHPGVRAEAAWTLAMVGPLAQEVVAELEALRQDTTLRVRNAANQTLRTFGR